MEDEYRYLLEQFKQLARDNGIQTEVIARLELQLKEEKHVNQALLDENRKLRESVVIEQAAEEVADA